VYLKGVNVHDYNTLKIKSIISKYILKHCLHFTRWFWYVDYHTKVHVKYLIMLTVLLSVVYHLKVNTCS